MDVYENFAELEEAEHEGDDFCVYIFKREGSSTVIVSPHGGRKNGVKSTIDP